MTKAQALLALKAKLNFHGSVAELERLLAVVIKAEVAEYIKAATKWFR